MRTDLLRLNGAVERDTSIDARRKVHAGESGAIAHHWFEGFEVMRKCGDEVWEVQNQGSARSAPPENSGSPRNARSSLLLVKVRC